MINEVFRQGLRGIIKIYRDVRCKEYEDIVKLYSGPGSSFNIEERFEIIIHLARKKVKRQIYLKN
jgi:hypothetical protein